MPDAPWITVGAGNWLRFDPLTTEEITAIVQRLDTDYGMADLAGRYVQAWLGVAVAPRSAPGHPERADGLRLGGRCGGRTDRRVPPLRSDRPDGAGHGGWSMSIACCVETYSQCFGLLLLTNGDTVYIIDDIVDHDGVIHTPDQTGRGTIIGWRGLDRAVVLWGGAGDYWSADVPLASLRKYETRRQAK